MPFQTVREHENLFLTETQQKRFSQYNQVQQEEVKDRIEELLFVKGNLAEEKFDDFLEKVM